MATGDTASAVVLPSSPPQFLGAQSPSNLSSPLSDVEDRDAYPDGMDLSSPSHNTARLGTPDRQREDGGDGGDDAEAKGNNSDSESKLSDVDVNDSEAETERLYDTPHKNTPRRRLANGATEAGGKQFLDRRPAAFEPSPSKLQKQVKADADAADDSSDDDPLSDPDDDMSLAGSEPDPSHAKDRGSRSQSPAKDTAEEKDSEDKAVKDQIDEEATADSRKRKRSSVAEQSESEQPLRKRTGSIGSVPRESVIKDTAAPDDEAASSNARSGEQTGEEDNTTSREATQKTKSETLETTEVSASETGRSRQTRRNGARKRKSPENGTEGPNESAQEDGETAPADEEGARNAEEEHADAEADEEAAETAQRNEEELERKKAAWEELSAIEKQFSNFRERLYQERLEQLNQEEAMLTADNPTHPEYLAMLQCIDERRDERIRIGKLELQLNKNVLKDKAVAERAQIMSQYFQGVRESREMVLDALGKEWYEIQHERRRDANHVPDYGIRFPTSKTQCLRDAVAYNKEVSILAGFAKYKGFPAAPRISGATDEQLDEDLECIKRAKPAAIPPPPVSQQPIQKEISAVPFGRSLGLAGEQFLEQTPWANPNHPLHQMQRQLSEQSPSATAGPATSRRHSHQPGGLFSSPAHSNFLANGDQLQMHKSHSAGGHESAKSKVVAEGGLKRETLLQAS